MSLNLENVAGPQTAFLENAGLENELLENADIENVVCVLLEKLRSFILNGKKIKRSQNYRSAETFQRFIKKMSLTDISKMVDVFRIYYSLLL